MAPKRNKSSCAAGHQLYAKQRLTTYTEPLSTCRKVRGESLQFSQTSNFLAMRILKEKALNDKYNIQMV